MWLTSSSVGRKLIMAITGAALILFLTFHALMNAVAIFWPAAYNVVCELLGANWYALIASAGLAVLFILHIIYALWLTVQNRKARGNERYAVNALPKGVEWSSKNMLVLGFVILAFLVLHLVQFWSKMQLAELTHTATMVDGVQAAPAAGTLFLQQNFSHIWVLVAYVVAFVALWFHLTHGFWSMFQSCGWDNDIWIKRLKCIGCWWTTIVVGLFLAEAVVFTCMAKCPDQPYLNCPKLQEQYEEMNAAFDAGCEAPCLMECEAAACDEACGEAACCGNCEGEGECAGACPDCPNAQPCAGCVEEAVVDVQAEINE